MVDIDECSPVPEPAPAHPDPASISPDAWRRFESAMLSVVHKIQPTVSSENLRAAVIDYVQRLFRFHAGYQNLANEVCAILKSEGRRKDSEFEVKDVRYIHATENNNLGCSVSKGNFYRIRSAFDFGARKLGKILQVPVCSIVNEVNQFFRNTLKRNCTGLRPDISVSSSDDGLITDHATNDSLSLGLNVEKVNKRNSPLYSNSYGDLSSQFSNIDISDSNNHGLVEQKQCNSMAGHKEIKSVSSGLLDSDATDHTTTDSGSVRNGGNLYEASPTARETCTLASVRCCAPHQFYQSEGGKKDDVRDDTDLPHNGMPTKHFTDRSHHSFEDAKYHNEFLGRFSPSLSLEHNAYSSAGLVSGLATLNSMFTPENSQLGCTTTDIVSDLTSDFNTNFHNLMYAQAFQQDIPVNQFYYPMIAPPPPQYQNMRPSNGCGRKKSYGYAGMNGAITSPPYPHSYLVWRPFYQTDDHMAMRDRGTGTYFPDPNLRKDRPPVGRGERGRNHFVLNN
ncbi:uncharacterized protein C2845_PM18G13840 [Panicum miliaceum]|uniref:PAP/OAS1 substrate-binding-related domain-containing protein n=1 Tax=Panicum miliaceum TaxID=4540 RepID=A0A3L6PMH5_PANMI|nr:uncharacterized protein C2845_PM18G13840 [Panicum miliaceum]